MPPYLSPALWSVMMTDHGLDRGWPVVRMQNSVSYFNQALRVPRRELEVGDIYVDRWSVSTCPYALPTIFTQDPIAQNDTAPKDPWEGWTHEASEEHGAVEIL